LGLKKTDGFEYKLFSYSYNQLETLFIHHFCILQCKYPDFQFKFTLAKVLNRLSDYRIVWQYKNEAAASATSAIKLDKHIKILTWLPQRALLAHPKTKLFVTHAGAKSMVESICFQTPVVIVPFFADQILNGMHLRGKKCGLIVEKGDFNEETLFSAFSRVLNDKEFKKSVEKLSNLNKYGMVVPQRELAIFWTEFSLRHGNKLKKFTTRRGMMMGYVEYYNIDIFLLALLIICVSLCVVLWFVGFFRKLL